DGQVTDHAKQVTQRVLDGVALAALPQLEESIVDHVFGARAATEYALGGVGQGASMLGIQALQSPLMDIRGQPQSGCALFPQAAIRPHRPVLGCNVMRILMIIFINTSLVFTFFGQKKTPHWAASAGVGTWRQVSRVITTRPPAGQVSMNWLAATKSSKAKD